jgi:DNA-binding transcriptional regulator YiaG
MKRPGIAFSAEDLVRSVEEVRDRVVERKAATLKTTRVRLPTPAPGLSPEEVGRLRARLRASQAQFAAMLNVPTVTAISWEKGRRKPSGAALRLLQIARRHPEILLAS